MEFDVFGLENVDVAFEKITPLKYSQPMALGGGFLLCVGRSEGVEAKAH